MQPSTRVVADRYLLLERIGEGGRAVVHRAHDQLLDRDVAIKLIRPEYAEDRDFVDRFGSEARNAAALHDPRIVTIFDSGIDAATGVDYIVMQLIHGQTLEKVLRERGRLPLADAVRIAAEAARALQIAHDRGLVHGSVKPGNILLDDNGGVRVGDFGIARAAGDGGASGSGVEIGSPEYVSPEQVNGEPATSASDLYSLGLVLDEMLTGKRPFGGPSPAAIAQQRLRLEPPPPSSIQHDVPRELDAIVARATQRNPRRRYASAAELAAALAEFQRAHLGDLTAPLGGGRTNPATAAPGVAAIAGVAGLAGGATAGMSMRAGTATERTRSWTMPGTASGTSGGAAVAASPAGSVLPGFRTGPVDDAPESLERRRHFAPPAILLPIVAIALVVLAARLVLSGVGEPPGSSAQPPVSSAVAAVQPSNGPGEPSNGGVPASSPVSSSSFTGSAASPVAAPSGDPPAPAASPSAASLRAGQTARPTPAATGRAAAAPTLRATPAPTPRPTPRPTPAPVVAPTPSPPSPGATVSTFYTLVAQHRFDEAAALWSPRMLEQYPPKRFINHRFAATTAIDVLRLDVTSESISQGTATVAVDLIEHRSDGSTRHWVGSWDLVLTSSGWLMDQSHF